MIVSFKKCTLSDLKVLIELSKSTFVAAFEKDNNPDDFKAYINSAFSEETIKSELSDPNSSFYFIYNDNILTGYFKLNENSSQNEQFKEDTIELERFYVLPEHQGKQIGKRTLVKVLEIAKAKKLDFLWLGVWEHNKRAIRFYERFGFQKFGIHPYFLGSDKQTDWLMKFELV